MKIKSISSRNIKITVMSLILAILMIAVSACSDGNNSSTTSSFDMKDAMNAALEAGTSLPEMTTVTDADGDASVSALEAVTDISSDKLQSYGVSYSTEGKADEIVILNLNNDNDADDAVESLKKHVEERMNLFSNYDSKEGARYQNADVFQAGSCVILVVCDDSDEVEAAIEGVISE